MKIAFYLDNSKISHINLSNPLNGNPGIGGTQFMIWMISYYLKLKYEYLNVILLANEIDYLPNNLECIKVNNIYDAARKSKEELVDIFIFRSVAEDEFYKLIDKLQLVSIAWAHNFSSSIELKNIVNCNYIKKYVCVGKQQYELLRDHEIINKSTYIYNCFDFNSYNKFINIEEAKENIICYTGSIVPSKGFHIICREWKKIKKRIPDCKLYIIGSAQLYDRNCKMGKYNIADERYERKFIKYIVDDKGKLQEDIEFFGVLGEEKKLEIMSKAKVGIVNPTARTETFGISATEFQYLGVPVVTKNKNGFVDTISNYRSGFLTNSKNDFVKKISLLLKDNDLNRKMSINAHEYVKEKFNIENIINEWYLLLQEVDKGIVNSKKELNSNLFINNLWLYEINRKIKNFKLFKNIPAISEYKSYFKVIFSKLTKIIN